MNVSFSGYAVLTYYTGNPQPDTHAAIIEHNFTSQPENGLRHIHNSKSLSVNKY